jgi:glycosyltransferase involved in cell wall biosynthesis
MSIDTNQSKICVAVPARGVVEKISECIESILATQYPYLEIIVVDDGLDNAMCIKLEQFKDRIKVLKSEGRGPSYARNLATRHTDAEFIAFTDSDCVVEKSWISELQRGFQEFPEIAACGGAQEIPADAASFEKSVFLFMKKCGLIADYARTTKNNAITKVNHNPSCNVMYRRDIFLKENGFLKGLWPGEDVELDYRLIRKGYKLVFNPRAIVYHYRPVNLKGFCRMMHRYGYAQGFLVRKYGIFRRIQVLPFLSLTAALLLLIAIVYKFYLLALLSAGISLVSLWLYFNNFFFITAFGILSWHLGFFKKFLGI